jgi:hypothetical protein
MDAVKPNSGRQQRDATDARSHCTLEDAAHTEAEQRTASRAASYASSRTRAVSVLRTQAGGQIGSWPFEYVTPALRFSLQAADFCEVRPAKAHQVAQAVEARHLLRRMSRTSCSRISQIERASARRYSTTRGDINDVMDGASGTWYVPAPISI